MTSMPIVIVLEGNKFCLQIRCRPEQQLVQTLAADCADQSLDKWMGPWSIGNRFDFRDTEDLGSLAIDETDTVDRDRN